ncbi:MAG: UDP-N-acetylmuramoyl-L-alanyl-D-glutamate--2,6-diaminopimelate ligase [Leptolyngbyaceae cyanobacterium SM1_1_3]|nr:UDP-N-acetylmuramoyl-L-alanyl-D-glutamate--2,6-diaminopimelate ligase [Leptolyngbyaceae cyanobacterium SM1_1_3]NJN04734.1 UDP-N-acetylmuramoyl-L-alanyl-D-glutamate--2,6-diaminopimelate ligase [Leptolyngbyaceae cyanobacterium RM1_1_2]
MKLRELLARLPQELWLPGFEYPEYPALEAEVRGLCTNSHACQSGNVFIGMAGTRVDGGEFWQSAVAAGAIAALISPEAYQKKPPTAAEMACVVPMTDMAIACAEVAAAFYRYPTRQMRLAGVTGTNGKTTTTHLIEFLLLQAQRPTALLGTLYSRWPGYQQTALHTTPFAVELQADLAAALAAGSELAVLEVSSHALAQKRVWGCAFEVAVFTNLTQDHLDYHKDLDDYFAAKAQLFSPNYLKGRAIINQRDAYGRRLLNQMSRDRVWTYSLENTSADLYTRDLEYQATGVRGRLQTPHGQADFDSPLVGQFNLENLLAAVGAALHLGVSLEQIVAVLPRFPGVPGRMEQVKVWPDQDVSVIVDYAHTPDSLENALKAARPFISGRLICVFGCGGDRDRSKRPQMGHIAQSADIVYVTSDNPRTEDPQKILQDITAGMNSSKPFTVICDRAEAIRTAILAAQSGDGILIAGKGHEDYQILGTEKIHFDDREQARQALQIRYC